MKANIERLTEKTIGCFQYDLKGFNHKPKEFNDYDAFFAYNMAVKKLGELEDKLEQGTLIEKPNNIIELMAEFILSTQEGYCLTCDNPMRNVNIRRQGSQGCDGNCQHYREYTKDDIIEMFECECQLEKENP